MNTHGRQTEDQRTVFHVKDLEYLLGVSHNTAYQLVRSGQIRSIKVGRTYKIPKSALEEFLCKRQLRKKLVLLQHVWYSSIVPTMRQRKE